MPIEFWWWVEPLFFTGYLTIIVLGILGMLIDKAWPGNLFSYVLAVLAIAPWLICFLAVVVWLLTNILIIIWR